MHFSDVFILAKSGTVIQYFTKEWPFRRDWLGTAALNYLEYFYFYFKYILLIILLFRKAFNLHCHIGTFT